MESAINKISNENLQLLLNTKSSINSVLIHLGFSPVGGARKTLLTRIAKDNLSLEELIIKRDEVTKSNLNKKKVPLDVLLVKDSTANRGSIKGRLIRSGILKNECQECGLHLIWNNKPIVLVLDHINGINNDYRIENLRLLCPNCNSQTPTFSGRNVQSKAQKNHCKNCCKILKGKALQCKDCRSLYCKRRNKVRLTTEEISAIHAKRRKVFVRPSLDLLRHEINSLGYSGTAMKYNVSNTAIRKWLKSAEVIR